MEANVGRHEVGTQRRRAFVASGIGWGLDGFDWTMFGFALPAITASLGLSESDGPFVVAASLIASAFGGVIGGTLADRFGRVRVLTFVILGYSLFTALTATAQNLEQLLFWRMLEGFAFGAEWAVGAALLAEYAIPAHRGRTMGFLQSTYAIGWALSTGAYLLLFNSLNDEVAWRYLFLVGILPAVAAFFIRLTVKDRVKTGPSDRAPISLPLLFGRDIRRVTILATLFGLGGQGTYYSVFVFLPTFLAEERGQTVVGTATYTWVVIAGSFFGYVLAGFIHDFLGRRRAFTLYYLGSAASIAAFVLVPIEGSVTTYAVSYLLGFFASGQAAGYGAFLAELFPSAMRGAGQGLAYNVGRGLAALGPGFIGMTSASIGLGNSILIVGFCACSLAIFCVWLLPETRGKVIVEPEVRERQQQMVGATG